MVLNATVGFGLWFHVVELKFWVYLCLSKVPQNNFHAESRQLFGFGWSRRVYTVGVSGVWWQGWGSSEVTWSQQRGFGSCESSIQVS